MFLQRLPAITLPFTAATGRVFRKGIILDLVELTGCTIAAASTHYAHAFHRVKEGEPELVLGLGRPEGKNNGGRKRKQAPTMPVDELCGDLGEQQQVFEVRRCKDNVAIYTGLSYEDARAKVEKAAAQKKGKLYWV
jgi:hypothetical protein